MMNECMHEELMNKLMHNEWTDACEPMNKCMYDGMNACVKRVINEWINEMMNDWLLEMELHDEGMAKWEMNWKWLSNEW